MGTLTRRPGSTAEAAGDLGAYLRALAPHRREAAHAIATTRIAVHGDRRSALARAVRAAVPAVATPTSDFIVMIRHVASRRGGAGLPVTALGERVLIGPAGDPAAHFAAARRLAAVAPTPGPDDLVAVAAAVVDEAVRAVAGVGEARALLRTATGIRRVELPAAPERGAPMWQLVTGEFDDALDEDGTDLLERTATLCQADVGLFADPDPGGLTQLPLALAATRVGPHGAYGHGDSQRAARATAVREAARLFVPSRRGYRRVAGYGGTELLADALLRLCTGGSPQPNGGRDPETDRWSRGLDLLGVPAKTQTARAVIGGLALGAVYRSRAYTAGLSRVAIGADPTSAAREATRGLLAAAQLRACGAKVAGVDWVRCADPAAVVAALPARRGFNLHRYLGEPELDRAGLICGLAAVIRR